MNLGGGGSFEPQVQMTGGGGGILDGGGGGGHLERLHRVRKVLPLKSPPPPTWQKYDGRPNRERPSYDINILLTFTGEFGKHNIGVSGGN